jgi:hypothetical protein
MGQGAGDSAQPRIADITQQDRQLQQVLDLAAGGVTKDHR